MNLDRRGVDVFLGFEGTLQGLGEAEQVESRSHVVFFLFCRTRLADPPQCACDRSESLACGLMRPRKPGDEYPKWVHAQTSMRLIGCIEDRKRFLPARIHCCLATCRSGDLAAWPSSSGIAPRGVGALARIQGKVPTQRFRFREGSVPVFGAMTAVGLCPRPASSVPCALYMGSSRSISKADIANAMQRLDRCGKRGRVDGEGTATLTAFAAGQGSFGNGAHF